MGIIFLDIALESCINEFIEKYNQDFEEEKLREIGEKYNEYGCKKMWSVGDFLKRDLKQLSEKLNSKSYFQDINDTVRDVKELHSRRNVIIHNRCRKESDRDDEIICTTIKLLNCLEDYIGREKVTNNLDDEFAPNPVAVTLSASDSRGYVYVRPYKSFTEATRPVADKKK